MKVAYITMQFPYPSETFASTDVRVLHELGVDMSVHSLRAKYPDAERLLVERDLEEVELTYNSFQASLAGLAYGLMRPSLLLAFAGWLIQVSWRNPKHLWKSLLLLPRVLSVFSWLEHHRPDVVHIYWGHYPSLVGYLVERYLPGTVVSISLGVYDLSAEYGGSRYVARRADVVKTLARVNLPHIVEFVGIPGDSVKVIYDSLDLKRVKHLATHSLKAKKVSKRVLTAGRLHPDKGMSEVLDAFARALQQHPDATLVVLGDGSERQGLEKKCAALGISHAVTFRGHVNHDDVFDEMATAEVFLFLSKAERLPNVVKEAMLSECVCIVTQTIGIEELIPDESFGFVVPVGDVEEAGDRLLQVLDHQNSIAAMLKNAKSHILENFDSEKAMQAYLESWRNVNKGQPKQYLRNEVTRA